MRGKTTSKKECRMYLVTFGGTKRKKNFQHEDTKEDTKITEKRGVFQRIKILLFSSELSYFLLFSVI